MQVRYARANYVPMALSAMGMTPPSGYMFPNTHRIFSALLRSDGSFYVPRRANLASDKEILSRNVILLVYLSCDRLTLKILFNLKGNGERSGRQ